MTEKMKVKIKNLFIKLKKEKTKMTKHRIRRKFTAIEKGKAVLSIWSERRSITEICEEMDISQNLVSRWQDMALESMLKSLDPVRSKEKPPALSKRLEKMLLKKSGTSAASKLEERLEKIQTTNEKK